MVALLAPVQERYRELRADEGELRRLLAIGAEKARAASAPTLAAMYERMGFTRPERAGEPHVLVAGVLAAVRGRRRAPLRGRVADRGLHRLAASRSRGLAWLVGVATESVGARFGPAVTGVLQSTLGNLPELFIVLFALSAGEIVVAQTSILGSLFANALLVLGLAIVAGRACAPTAR